MTPAVLQSLLEAGAQGQTSVPQALDQLKHLHFRSVEDFAKIDHHRQLRTGFPEVIWGQVKRRSKLCNGGKLKNRWQ